MQCRACDHHLIEKSRFCDDCGIATAALELDSEGLLSYCGKCAGLLRGTKKYCIYCGEPSPHSPKYKKKKESSWIEEVLLDPRVQMAIVGILLIVAALPAVTPVRYRMKSEIPFVEVAWGDEQAPSGTARTTMPRRDAYSMEPLVPQNESREDGLNIAMAAGVTRDSKGNLYVSDSVGNRVYRIAPDGTRNVFAGTGAAGFSGDGGAADKAELKEPRGLAVDDLDNVYIADSGNNRIRRVNERGIIKTIAGTDVTPATASSSLARYADADKAVLLSPTAVATDMTGDLFVAESACQIGDRKPTVWVLKQKM
jgi:hypothetical protein